MTFFSEKEQRLSTLCVQERHDSCGKGALLAQAVGIWTPALAHEPLDGHLTLPTSLRGQNMAGPQVLGSPGLGEGPLGRGSVPVQGTGCTVGICSAKGCGSEADCPLSIQRKPEAECAEQAAGLGTR